MSAGLAPASNSYLSCLRNSSNKKRRPLRSPLLLGFEGKKATWDTLRFSRGLSQDSSCSVCGAAVEDSLHALRDCHSVRDIWVALGLNAADLFNKELEDWFKSNLSIKDKGLWKVILFATTLWRLLTSRCRQSCF